MWFFFYIATGGEGPGPDPTVYWRRVEPVITEQVVD